MGNTRWYGILNRAYKVDWELDDGFQWLNMNRWYDLSLEDAQEVISRYEGNQLLLPLSELQVKYAVDRYGLRQIAERVEKEMDNRDRHRVYTMDLKSGVA